MSPIRKAARELREMFAGMHSFPGPEPGQLLPNDSLPSPSAFKKSPRGGVDVDMDVKPDGLEKNRAMWRKNAGWSL